MLRITVELLPHGRPDRARHLGTALISNDGTGDETHANYVALFSKWGRPNETWRRGTVLRFPRQRRGPWDLLYCCLHAAVGSRNPTRPVQASPPAPPPVAPAPRPGTR
jgi:hypothetical protein